MKISDYTLPNGTPSKIIEAEEGYTLMKNGEDYGNKLILGVIYRDVRGNILSTPTLEQPTDYTEVVVEDETDEINQLIRTLLDE